ncbi:fungal hydrophobin [Mycena pura]|uniref:Hydrophobin n=1 Tax=Mycena pura TaxID=153505 RepID=A0AAD6Y1M1_9AGAR|nr:fungal hydrophobin [Mycena pura]
MFFKLPLLATAILATLAAAAPNAPPPPPGTNSLCCALPGTTNLCCSTVGTNSDPVISEFAAGLGVSLTNVLGNIGIGCTVLTVVGNTCSNTAVNCDSNQLGFGLINVGCVPITL